MANKDANQEALEQVERITESSRDNGEDLLESEDLKRQLREAGSASAYPSQAAKSRSSSAGCDV